MSQAYYDLKNRFVVVENEINILKNCSPDSVDLNSLKDELQYIIRTLLMFIQEKKKFKNACLSQLVN